MILGKDYLMYKLIEVIVNLSINGFRKSLLIASFIFFFWWIVCWTYRPLASKLLSLLIFFILISSENKLSKYYFRIDTNIHDEKYIQFCTVKLSSHYCLYCPRP